MVTPLSSLSPQRRRLVVSVAIALVAGGLGLGFLAWSGQVPTADPVAQDRPGPVLLHPGYGGNVDSLSALAATLTGAGREVIVIDSPGDGTGDLREQAENLDRVARAEIDEGASSVDVVGYSAGGVVARWWVAELGGDKLARRVITLASPHDGTDLSQTALELTPDACVEACAQLAPDSELLRTLNAGDPTPAGPQWLSLWTETDRIVTPPSSASLEGAVDTSIQALCGPARIEHGEVPREPVVLRVVVAALDEETVQAPDPLLCNAP